MSKLFAELISLRKCATALILAFLCGASLSPTRVAAAGADSSYWLTLDRGRQKIECTGDTSGQSFTASNNAESWVQVSGVVTCKDDGNFFTIEVNFVSAEINPQQRASIGRDSLIFDWIGLVAYGPDGKGGVQWLYDDALAIRGSLKREGKEKIYFGNLKFNVPKDKLARADHFVFYLTAQGALTSFYLGGAASPMPAAIQSLPIPPPSPSATASKTAAAAADSSYWLTLGGGRNKIECPGDVSGQSFRASNYADSWLQVTGVVTCKDSGNSYAYEVNFIGAEINPEQRSSIGRETLVFDWMGLAVYGPDGKGGIDWMYDDALPISGSLKKEGKEKIYFGNLKFSVPKEKPPVPTTSSFTCRRRER